MRQKSIIVRWPSGRIERIPRPYWLMKYVGTEPYRIAEIAHKEELVISVVRGYLRRTATEFGLTFYRTHFSREGEVSCNHSTYLRITKLFPYAMKDALGYDKI